MNPMNYKTSAITPAAEGKPAKKLRVSSRLYTSTVQYTLIASLVVQQYQQKDRVLFDRLLAIPLEDRIPGLIEKYGKKTVHQLLLMVLKEFCAAVPLPLYKKPTETRLSVAACEIMLSAEEDFLSLEDIMIFLQNAKAGTYGPIKTLVTTTVLLQMLEEYRQQRHTAYLQLKEEADENLKKRGQELRIASEPTSINELLQTGLVVDMTQKMSG